MPSSRRIAARLKKFHVIPSSDIAPHRQANTSSVAAMKSPMERASRNAKMRQTKDDHHDADDGALEFAWDGVFEFQAQQLPTGQVDAVAVDLTRRAFSCPGTGWTNPIAYHRPWSSCLMRCNIHWLASFCGQIGGVCFAQAAHMAQEIVRQGERLILETRLDGVLAQARGLPGETREEREVRALRRRVRPERQRGAEREHVAPRLRGGQLRFGIAQSEPSTASTLSPSTSKLSGSTLIAQTRGHVVERVVGFAVAWAQRPVRKIAMGHPLPE